MKFALALLALVATASALEIPNFGRGELYKDIQEFLDLIPLEQVSKITVQYYAEDKEFQNMIRYYQTEGFKQLVNEVEHLPEIKVFMDYVHEAGIDVYKIVNMFNDLLGLDHLIPPNNYAINTQITGGIRGYVDDILAVLPKDKLNALYAEKLKSSPAFANFIAQLQSDNFQQIVNKVYLHPKFQELLKHAENAGIDLLLIKDLLLTIWGIRVPPRPIFYIRR